MRVRWIVVVIAAAVALTGCVAGPEPVSIADLPASQVPPADQDPAVICAGFVDRDKGCLMATDECHEWEFAEDGDVEQLAGWALQTPVDSGPAPHAAGEAILDADGIPIAYVVASDDLADFISERFCINQAYLFMINSVRRDGSVPLYAGDTLNLDAHTILSVGDQNGQVFDHPANGVFPPQR